MQRQNTQQNSSSFFTRTGPYASTGFNRGAFLGGAAGLTAALFVAFVGSEENKFKNQNSPLFLIALGAVGGTAGGAIIGGVGGASIGFTADIVSAGIEITFKR